MRDIAMTYRLEAERCFSIACAAHDSALRAQSLSDGIHWLHLAEELEQGSTPKGLRLVHSR